MAYNKQESSAYAAAHMWVRYHYGRPQRCDNCHTTEPRMYHWANISRTYKRERSDWLRLCVPCHKRHDVTALGGKIRSRPQKVQPSKICPQCRVEFFKNPKLSMPQWQATYLCSKACSARLTGKKLKGSSQSEATKALKTEKLKQRWATNKEWREHISQTMRGNQNARKAI